MRIWGGLYDHPRLIIFFWSILVFGYNRMAMEIHMAMSVALAFLLTLITVALGQLAVGQT